MSSSCRSLLLCHMQYASMVAPEQATITVDAIYPATEKHISKHSTQKFMMVSMTLHKSTCQVSRISLTAYLKKNRSSNSPSHACISLLGSTPQLLTGMHTHGNAAKACLQAPSTQEQTLEVFKMSQMQKAKESELFSFTTPHSNAGGRDRRSLLQ